MLQKADQNQFDKLYALLTDSFPVDELRPMEEQRRLFLKHAYTIWTTPEENAVITLWEFSDFVYVEHFAVAPQCRNLGLGKMLLSELLAKYRKPCCLEVEPPDAPLSARRIHFYKRNGFFLNSYPYMQPAYAPNQKSIPLLLMTTGDRISEKKFEEWKNILYKAVYGL